MSAERCLIRIAVFCIAAIIIALIVAQLLTFFAYHPEILLIILCLLIIGAILYVWLRRPGRRTRTQGSARWAVKSELRHARLFLPYFKREKHWFRLGRYGRRVIALSEPVQQAHILTVAPTRAGKSTTMIIPNLLQEQGKRSLLINDLKGELVQLCRGSLSEFLPCYVFAPTLPHQSACYNPLTTIKSLEDAQDVAECIVRNTGGTGSEPFWDNSTRLILTATLLHIRASDPQAPFSALAQVLTTDIHSLQKTIENSPSPLARSIAGKFLSNVLLNERLSGSVMTEVNSRLLSLKIPAIEHVTRANTIPLDSPTPVAIFLHIPPDQAERLKWLSSCFTMQLMKSIVNQPSGQQWAFYLDELANMGYIPHYLQYISYVGGLGVSLIQAAQDFGQLEHIYGEDGLSTILANSATQLVFPGCGLRETTHYSSLLGETTTYVSSYTWQGIAPLLPTRGRTETRRNLMNPDELRTLKQGRLIVFSKNLPAFQIQTRPYFRDRQLQARSTISYQPPQEQEVATPTEQAQAQEPAGIAHQEAQPAPLPITQSDPDQSYLID